MTRGADGKRRASPSSAAIVSAVRSSMPRKQRRRSTRARSGSIVSRSRNSVSTALEPGDAFVDGADVGAMRLLERGERPALGLQPVGMAFRPRLLGRGEAAAVAEQEFREAVPRAEEIGADVFATPQQIAGGFFLLGGNVNGRERAGAIQDGELAGIAAIGFDAIAGPPGNERGRDDVTRDAVRGERALELEATRAGFVAALHGPWRRRRSTKRRIVGLSDVSVCSAGVRWPGSNTAATVVAAW